MGVQVGEGGTQINYYYGERTYGDGVVAPPLVSVSGAIDSPYRGLSAFEERDAAFFFGREAAATQVLERMSRHLEGMGLLVVSGVSGAGKSSLLRAGVLPRMRGAGVASAPGSASWPCLLFTPGRAPLDEIAVRVARLAGADAAAMRRGLDADPAGFALTARQAVLAQADGPAKGPDSAAPQRRLVLVVDQFEQLFTQCPDEQHRQAFIAALYAAATAGHGPEQAPAALVVLGVRADFEARCADYQQLASAIQHRYLVTAMTERQLRMAITEPAKKAGSRVDDDLTELLLRQVRTPHGAVSGAGMLPLLSHALDQAWRHRTGDFLTLADYERTGGIEGALADSAQRAYDRLTHAQQAVARQVFTRLTATSPDRGDTADRATRTELTVGRTPAEARDVEAVLEAFATARLLTLAAGTVEISHEILLTAWPLLRDTWLADTHADRIIRTRLNNTANEWARNSRDPTYLYSGSLLAAATDTAARIGADHVRHPPLSQTEQEFLYASNRAHRRRTRLRHSLIAFLTAIVIALASILAFAVRASQQATYQRDVAVSAQLAIQSEAMGETNPVLSRLLSIAAWRISPTSDARHAMLTAGALPEIGILIGHTAAADSVAFSPDGKTLASASTDNTIRLWDVANRHPIGTLTGHTDTVNSVAFSPDGKTLASASIDQTVRLWDVATRRPVGRPLTGNAIFWSVAFSPDGKTLASASGSPNHTVQLWDVATHRPIGRPLTGHRKVVKSLAFSPDGKTLASASADNTIRLWSVATGYQIGMLISHGVNSVAFSPDGKTLASASIDQTVQLWDVATRRSVGGTLTGHTDAVNSVAFSPDGKTLATGSDDNTIRLWDVATGHQIGLFTGHTSFVASVAFSLDGKTLASASGDGTIRLWNLAVGRLVGSPLTGHTDAVNSVAFSPDGKTLASASDDRTIRLWDMTTRRPIGILTGHTDMVDWVAFSPDGKTLASASWDYTIRLWDVATRRPVGILTGYTGPMSFSSDGKTLATGSPIDDTVRLWDVATRRPIGILTGHTDTVNSVAFSPDGKTLASASGDGTIRLWDMTTRRPIGILTGHTDTVNSVAFSPDGKTLAGVGGDNTIGLWDVATRRPIGGPVAGYANTVNSVAFSPDGKTLAIASDDDKVRLWDVATRRLIGTPLAGHTNMVNSVAFSPDGKTLASASGDGTIRLWDVVYIVDLVPQLCVSAGRPLTHAEWARYVPPGPPYQSVCP